MRTDSVSITDLGHMIQQTITSEGKKSCAFQRHSHVEPPFPPYDGYRVPWGDDFVFYHLALMMGLTGFLSLPIYLQVLPAIPGQFQVRHQILALLG